jgi:SAM-dependent methyltransferase
MAGIEDRHWWYGGLRAIIREAWMRHVLVASPALLDVGCGTGANLTALRDVARPVGIDIAPEAIDFCRRRGLAQTAAASAAALPFAAASFDVALSCDVLSHRSLPDRRVPLAEIRRVLRPGGVLLLNVPAYQWMLSAHDRAVHQDRRFSRREVAGLLVESGFAVEDIRHWNAALLPAAVAVRWVRGWMGATGSDLARGSGAVLAAPFAAVLHAERVLQRHLSIPFGLSIFAVARRPAEAP